MFDFESDQVDPRFAPPDPNAPPSTTANTPAVTNPTNGTTAPPTLLAAPPVTRQNDAPVIIPKPMIPPPLPMPPPAARSMPPTPRHTGQRPRARRYEWIWLAIPVMLIAVFVVMGLALAVMVNASAAPNTPTADIPIAALPTPVDARTHDQVPTTLRANQQLTLDDGSKITLQPWNGTDRFTILLMGIDRRTGETGLGYRSDTMMLASFDPATQQLGILSIPRDLYVQIPGYSKPQRINTALALGELQRPGYGPMLAMQAVQYNLGVGVNAYLVADFNALITFVDAIGGIDVDVPSAIADYDFPDLSYGYDPLILSAGLQHMDGYLAQKYARTRHGDSDFDRAARQQQVIFAIRDRILSLSTLPQLIVQAPSLYASLSQNVYTELSLDQMLRLGLWLKDLPSENIHTGVIDQHYVYDYTTEDGAAVLMPYEGALPSLLTKVFGSDYR